jgi:hypothetical protein
MVLKAYLEDTLQSCIIDTSSSWFEVNKIKNAGKKYFAIYKILVPFTKLTCDSDLSFRNFLLWNTFNFGK